MPRKPATKKLTAAAARKMTGSALWTAQNAISAKFKDMRTAEEVAELKVVQAELNRRATAMMSQYFVGIF